MTKKLLLSLMLAVCFQMIQATDLTKATIVYQKNDAPLVRQMAQVLADDIERVSGIRPQVDIHKGKGANIIIGTVKHTRLHREIRGAWERYAIDTKGGNIYITGSDARGLAYGVLHVSEAIGVSPWYWFADVPVDKNKRVFDYTENYVSQSPSIKYRGIFINDEDWGLKTWASLNFEKELGDIGPKTYDKVCELILRLKGNMLAPAMHTCTGAFYSHPESQVMADKWGIMITTSHCEPLLFNNAAPSEWDKARDGEWNYETNSATILKKLDSRIRETAQYDNIYTMGMRGLHDEAMKGSKDPKVRARTLEKVMTEQRAILEKYKGKKATSLPQIFVPYKETLDIYDAGLHVPDDITLVWPDDNYGYMKRVSNANEQRRSGHSGLYYHISYLGTPHDNLWIATTAPMLMYEELLKAYHAGADRYWLLNVGDIKPMEIETQMFFDMAYDFKSFSYSNINSWQAQWLAGIFGKQHKATFQFILDNYYRLAWDRKPEFMGYEYEWSSPEENRLHDTDFSFETGTAQKRLVDYQNICFAYNTIEGEVSEDLRPALFEMLGYAVHGAYQMNRKFLYAQANHETGNIAFAEQSKDAYRQIELLTERYNTQLNGKWNQMISEVPPGLCAKYQLMPELCDQPTDAYRLPTEQIHPEFANKIDLTSLCIKKPFRLLEGIGTDWKALQLGQPLDLEAQGSIDISLPVSTLPKDADSVHLCISVVPMWSVASDLSNRFSVSVDGGKAEICENKFTEWSPEWKLQVLENRKEFVLTLPLDRKRSQHVITLSIIDPGQIIQKITYQYCFRESTSCGPVPTADQLRWQEMEMYAFIHYSLNTYTDQEWGFGNEDPKLFNPSSLDCRQWARVCKQAGMKGIIFTAKHHCGFCMWPSAYTEYSVKNSPWKDGKGDVVRELAEACREEGLKFAVYLSPWDRNHPEYGRPAYVTYFRNQLRELLTNYGDIFEVWFDGANGGDGWYGGANETRKIDRTTYYEWPETYRMIRELQPHCVIWNDGGDRGDLRWVGTEAGNVGETNWSLLYAKGDVPYQMLHYGVEDGDVWCPGETNTSIRPGWFYHDSENEHVKSLSKLMDTYYKSVGRNSTLLLNFPIAPNGRIHPNDSLRGIAFKKMIDEVFKENLVKKAKISQERNVTTIDFGKPTAFNRFLVEEDIAQGQRVRKFSLEALTDGRWLPLKDALVEQGDGLTTIGHRRIICFPTVTASKLRFTITDSKAEAIIRTLGVYLAPELTADIPDSGEKKSSDLHIFFGSPMQMFIDWDTEQTISSFRYLPPQESHDGIITHYTLWGSTDWANWNKLASGEFSNIINNPIWQNIKFNPAKVRVLRFEADHISSGTRMGYGDIEIK